MVVWVSGLPGSGKTTLASKIMENLKSRMDKPFVYVSMDEIRHKIFPSPVYSDDERDVAYKVLVLLASFLSRNGHGVMIDASGHKLVWRDEARAECPSFMEVYVRCPVEVCIERETKRTDQGLVRKKLYVDALERLRTGRRIQGLGKMPGVDEEFEESPNPELAVDCLRISDENYVQWILQRILENIEAQRIV